MPDELLHRINGIEREIENLKVFDIPSPMWLDVRLHGVRGNNILDDTARINSAANAARAAGIGLFFPPPISTAYYCAGQVDLRGITNILMQGPIRTTYAGAAVLAGGNSALMENARFDLAVYRNPIDASAGNICLVLYNLRHSEVTVRYTRGAEVGLKCLAETGLNFAYNALYLGNTSNNKTDLLLSEDGTGWVNENSFYCGNFTGSVAGSVCCIDCSGSNNHFWKPAFQHTNGVNGVIFRGSNCHVHAARFESTALDVATFEAAADRNSLEFGSYYGGTATTIPTYSVVHGAWNNSIYRTDAGGNAPLVPILEVTDFKFAYDDGDSGFHVPGFAWQTNGAAGTMSRAVSWANVRKSLDEHFIELSATTYWLGVMVDVSYVKDIWLRTRDEESGSYATPTVYVRCYDAAGADLEGTAPYYVEGLQSTQVFTHYYRLTTWRQHLLHFHTDVKTAFIGIGYRSTTPVRCAGFSLLVGADSVPPAVWPGYAGPLELPGHYIASQAPTKSTLFYQGDQVWNSAATSGGAPGWMVVFRLDTTLNGGEPSGETAIAVNSIVGVASGDRVGVEQDDGTMHWSTVNGAPGGGVITITDALTDDAASGNAMVVWRWKAMANLA